jgi:hypothetical protein
LHHQRGGVVRGWYVCDVHSHCFWYAEMSAVGR